MDKSKLKTYGLSILLAEAVGAVSGFITSSGMQQYAAAEKPALSPPAILFPIVWTVLYALMGIGSARIYLAPESRNRTVSLVLYGVQLVVNFFWSLIFFGFHAYGFAFFWLLALLGVIIAMTEFFSKVDKTAALLQIPYILWVGFATYLNFMVWRLN